MRNHLFASALVAVLSVVMSACSPIYVVRAGFEEARILSRRTPLEEVIQNPNTDPETRRKLQLVQQARTFAHGSLDLAAGKNYTTYSRLDRDTLALVVSASRNDRFEPYTWWFPIVGRVPYKGFFSQKSAEKAAASLQKKGYDTDIRPTSAFSTLGWFSDPVLSTMLRYDDVSVFSTIVHELTHATIFIPSQVAFNESFANFVGDRGTVDYFCDLEGDEGPRCQAARAQWQDDLLFSRYLGILIPDLEAVYARTDLPLEERLRLREEVHDRDQKQFLEEYGDQLSPGYRRLIGRPLNNARLVAVRLYYHRLDLFEAALQRNDQDMRATIRAIIDATKGSKDPYAALAQLSSDSP